MVTFTFKNFRRKARDSLTAAAWLNTNAHRMNSDFTNPWVATASEDEIEAFLDRQLTQGCGLEDLQNHTVFDFKDGGDLTSFTHAMRSTTPSVRVNVTLNGEEYLENNTLFL